MITKDGVIYRAFEGDYHPVNIFVGENKVAGYVSEIAEGQEIEMEGTYNDSYDGIKLFGKSEQKAEWRQAEGVTNQNGEPSPESPVDMISNIPAGSYQIPAENGIYEVTLAEDLRGIDDTYRDRICFDSVSGTGYRLNHVGKKEFDETTSFDAWQRVKNFGFRTPLENCSTGTPFSDYSLCTHFKNNYTLAYGGNGGYFGTGDAYFNGCMDSGEVNSLAQLSAFLKQEKEKGTPVTVYYVLKTPVKEALTFTKVETSSLPVLPWTAYGENLVGEYAYNFEFTGTKNKEIIIPVNAKTTGEYTISCTVTDKSDITYSSSGSLVSLEFKYLDDTDSYGSLASVADWVGDVTESTSNPYKKLKQIRIWKHDRFTSGTIKLSNIMLNIGQLKAYEPFNPTPPEALEVSPDYPQKIYDLSDVTVTSRGKTLEEMGTPYDKYRCTEAEVPVVSSALEIEKALYDTLPNEYGRYTANGKYYACDFVKTKNGNIKYVRCIADDVVDGTLSFGTDGQRRFFRGGYPYTFEKDSIVYCTSTHLQGITHAQAYYNQKAGVSKMNGTISVTRQGFFADMTLEDFNAWLVQQNSLGTPFTVRYIRKAPVVTDCTGEEWAQDLLGLKTAPYYTKLFADKETGGLRSFYKTFQTGENEVLTGYLLTSDGEYVVTNDGKTVIQF